jgi:hypothetical protein
MNRSIRSGKWSLILSVVLILWLTLVAALGSVSASNDIAAAVVGALFLASWLIVPVLIVAILVLAVIALLLNPVRGKILAAIAVVAPFVAYVVAVAVTGGFDAV